MRRWWRLWWDRDVLCAVHRSQWRLCCDKGMTKQSVLVCRNLSEIRTRKDLTTFGLQPVTTLFEMETECEYIHSKGNCPLFRIAYLAKSYDASVVSYLTWKLGVTFFFESPCINIISSVSRQRWGQMRRWPHLHEPKVALPPPCGRQCPEHPPTGAGPTKADKKRRTSPKRNYAAKRGPQQHPTTGACCT